jgi:large subunit ribosomal protein L4
MNVAVYNQEGKEVGKVKLKPELFGVEPSPSIVHQYVVNYLARQRQGTAKTKQRSEVRGGGRKPYRQKGTGRARAGTIRSPLWRGGGTTFGPKPRSYGSKLPKKMKRKVFQSIFSDKASTKSIKVLDQISFEEPKTKAMASVLVNLGLENKKCLVLDEGKNDNLVMACRNLQRTKYSRASLANGYDMVNADVLVMTKAGLKEAEEVFA